MKLLEVLEKAPVEKKPEPKLDKKPVEKKAEVKKPEPKEEKKPEEKKDASEPDAKETKQLCDRLCHLIFKSKSGPVYDKKRSKDPIFLGVANEESLITNERGNKIKLTFDNSTDSGEFELNSLSPLMIEKDSDMDKDIKKLYKEYKIHSSKRTNYTLKGGMMVLREVHVGKYLADRTVEFMRDLLEVFKSEASRKKKVDA